MPGLVPLWFERRGGGPNLLLIHVFDFKSAKANKNRSGYVLLAMQVFF